MMKLSIYSFDSAEVVHMPQKNQNIEISHNIAKCIVSCKMGRRIDK